MTRKQFGSKKVSMQHLTSRTESLRLMTATKPSVKNIVTFLAFRLVRDTLMPFSRSRTQSVPGIGGKKGYGH